MTIVERGCLVLLFSLCSNCVIADANPQRVIELVEGQRDRSVAIADQLWQLAEMGY